MDRALHRASSLLLSVTLIVTSWPVTAVGWQAAGVAPQRVRDAVFSSQALAARVLGSLNGPAHLAFGTQLRHQNPAKSDTSLTTHPEATPEDRQIIEEAEALAQIWYGARIFPSGKTYLAQAHDLARTVAENSSDLADANAIAAALLFGSDDAIPNSFPHLASRAAAIERLRRGVGAMAAVRFDPQFPPHGQPVPANDVPDYTLENANGFRLQQAYLVLKTAPAVSVSDADAAAVLCLYLAQRLYEESTLPDSDRPALERLEGELMLHDSFLASTLGLTRLSAKIQDAIAVRLYPDAMRRTEQEIADAIGMTRDEALVELGGSEKRSGVKQRAERILEAAGIRNAVIATRVKYKHTVHSKNAMTAEQVVTKKTKRPATTEHQYDLNGAMFIVEDDVDLEKLWTLDLQVRLGPDREHPSFIDTNWENKPIRRSVWINGKLAYRTVGAYYMIPEPDGSQKKFRIELQFMTRDYYKNYYLTGQGYGAYTRAHPIYKNRLALARQLNPEHPRDPPVYLGQQFDSPIFLPDDLPTNQLTGPKGLVRRLAAIHQSLDPYCFILYSGNGNRYIRLPKGSLAADVLAHPTLELGDPRQFEVYESVKGIALATEHPVDGGGVYRIGSIGGPTRNFPRALVQTRRARMQSASLGPPTDHFIQECKAYLATLFGDPDAPELIRDVLEPARLYLGLSHPMELMTCLIALKSFPEDVILRRIQQEFNDWYDRRFIRYMIESPQPYGDGQILLSTSTDEDLIGITVDELDLMLKAGASINHVEVEAEENGNERTNFVLNLPETNPEGYINAILHNLRGYRRRRGTRNPSEDGRRLHISLTLRDADDDGRPVDRGTDLRNVLACLSDVDVDVISLMPDGSALDLTVVAPHEITGYPRETPIDALNKLLSQRPEIQKETGPKSRMVVAQAPTTPKALFRIAQMLESEWDRLPDASSRARWTLEPDRIEALQHRASRSTEGGADHHLQSRMRGLIRFLQRFEGDINGSDDLNFNTAETQRRGIYGNQPQGTPNAIYALAILYRLIFYGVDNPVTLAAAALRDVERHGPENVLFWVRARQAEGAWDRLENRFPPLPGFHRRLDGRGPLTDPEILTYAALEIAHGIRTEFSIYGDDLQLAIRRLQPDQYDELLNHGTVNDIANRLAGRVFNLLDSRIAKPQTYSQSLWEYGQNRVSDSVRWFLPLIVRPLPEDSSASDRGVYTASRIDFLTTLITRTVELAQPTHGSVLQLARGEMESQSAAITHTLGVLEQFSIWLYAPDNADLTRQVQQSLPENYWNAFRAQLADFESRLRSTAGEDFGPVSALSKEERVKGAWWAAGVSFFTIILGVMVSLSTGHLNLGLSLWNSPSGFFFLLLGAPLLTVAISLGPVLLVYVLDEPAIDFVISLGPAAWGYWIAERINHEGAHVAAAEAPGSGYDNVRVESHWGHLIVFGRNLLTGRDEPVTKHAFVQAAKINSASRMRLGAGLGLLTAIGFTAWSTFVAPSTSIPWPDGVLLCLWIFVNVWTVANHRFRNAREELPRNTLAELNEATHSITLPYANTVGKALNAPILYPTTFVASVFKYLETNGWEVGRQFSLQPTGNGGYALHLPVLQHPHGRTLNRWTDEPVQTLFSRSSFQDMLVKAVEDYKAEDPEKSPPKDAHRRLLEVDMADPTAFWRVADVLKKDEIYLEKIDVEMIGHRPHYVCILIGLDKRPGDFERTEAVQDELRKIHRGINSLSLMDYQRPLVYVTPSHAKDSLGLIGDVTFTIEDPTNQPGSLDQATEAIAADGWNIREITLREKITPKGRIVTMKFGLADMRTQGPMASIHRALRLRDQLSQSEVRPIPTRVADPALNRTISFRLRDTPGTLHAVTQVLSQLGVNVTSVDMRLTEVESRIAPRNGMRKMEMNLTLPPHKTDSVILAALVSLNTPGAAPIIADIDLSTARISQSSARQADAMYRQAFLRGGGDPQRLLTFIPLKGELAGEPDWKHFLRNVRASKRIMDIVHGNSRFRGWLAKRDWNGVYRFWLRIKFSHWTPIYWTLRFMQVVRRWMMSLFPDVPKWRVFWMGTWPLNERQARRADPRQAATSHMSRVAHILAVNGERDRLNYGAAVLHDAIEDAAKAIYDYLYDALDGKVHIDWTWALNEYEIFFPRDIIQLRAIVALAKRGDASWKDGLALWRDSLERQTQAHLFTLIRLRIRSYPDVLIDKIKRLSNMSGYDQYAKEFRRYDSAADRRLKAADQADNLETAFAAKRGEKTIAKNIRHIIPLLMMPYAKEEVDYNVLKYYFGLLIREAQRTTVLPPYYDDDEKDNRKKKRESDFDTLEAVKQLLFALDAGDAELLRMIPYDLRSPEIAHFRSLLVDLRDHVQSEIRAYETPLLRRQS